MLAAVHAWRMASCREIRAESSPARTMLLPPATLLPSTDFSSPTTQEVLLPPRSIPRKYATRLFYHKGLTLQVQTQVLGGFILHNYATGGVGPASSRVWVCTGGISPLSLSVWPGLICSDCVYHRNRGG